MSKKTEGMNTTASEAIDNFGNYLCQLREYLRVSDIYKRVFYAGFESHEAIAKMMDNLSLLCSKVQMETARNYYEDFVKWVSGGEHAKRS